MGILSEFFRKKDVKAETLSRRTFLRNIVQAAPVAVAVAAGLEMQFVPEIKAAAREQLHKIDEMVAADLGIGPKIQIAVPKTAFDPNSRVWRSVANESYAWADYVSAKTGVSRANALRVTTRLAELVDRDLRASGTTADQKIDVELPVVTRMWETPSGGGSTEKHCEIGLGVHTQKLYDGTDGIRVAFVEQAKKIVDSNGREFAFPKEIVPAIVPAELRESFRG